MLTRFPASAQQLPILQTEVTDLQCGRHTLCRLFVCERFFIYSYFLLNPISCSVVFISRLPPQDGINHTPVLMLYVHTASCTFSTVCCVCTRPHCRADLTLSSPPRERVSSLSLRRPVDHDGGNLRRCLPPQCNCSLSPSAYVAALLSWVWSQFFLYFHTHIIFSDVNYSCGWSFWTWQMMHWPWQSCKTWWLG